MSRLSNVLTYTVLGHTAPGSGIGAGLGSAPGPGLEAGLGSATAAAHGKAQAPGLVQGIAHGVRSASVPGLGLGSRQDPVPVMKDVLGALQLASVIAYDRDTHQHTLPPSSQPQSRSKQQQSEHDLVDGGNTTTPTPIPTTASSPTSTMVDVVHSPLLLQLTRLAACLSLSTNHSVATNSIHKNNEENETKPVHSSPAQPSTVQSPLPSSRQPQPLPLPLPQPLLLPLPLPLPLPPSLLALVSVPMCQNCECVPATLECLAYDTPCRQLHHSHSHSNSHNSINNNNNRNSNNDNNNHTSDTPCRHMLCVECDR